MTITPDSLMTLEAYAKIRKSSSARRSSRTASCAPCTWASTSACSSRTRQTIRRQIQEMLHIEKIFDEEGIQGEIDAYAPLVPDGSNWKATMLIEYPDVHERKRELARLIGVEDRMFVEVEGHARVYAIADEDLDRENDEKTSAVHFVRFEFAKRGARRGPRRRGRQARLRPHPLPGARDHRARDAGEPGRRSALAAPGASGARRERLRSGAAARQPSTL